MSATPTQEPVKTEAAKVYDPAAKNRFEFEVRENGQLFDTAHTFSELTDERYIQWLKEMNVRGDDGGEIEEESREASCRLWDDVIDTVDGVEFAEGDWKSFVPFSEKVEAINAFLAVAIYEDPQKQKTRRLGPQTELTVYTEAMFNGDVLKQTHFLRPKTLELEKKYSRIQANRFKQEQVNGFRNKRKVTYVPQDEKLGQLYDEMLISVNGFAVGFDNKPTIPLRFKTAVIHEIFASKLDPKK